MRSANMQDIAHLSPVIIRAKEAPKKEAIGDAVVDPVVEAIALLPSHIAAAMAPIPGHVAAEPIRPTENNVALTEAINAFPGHLAAAMASMPAPVMAPRPEGSWIIDVSRDSSGQMTQLAGKFYATK